MTPATEGNAIRRPLLTIVTPAYNEAENLPHLYRRLHDVLDGMEGEWEWIVVDDHSSDETSKVLAQLAEKDDRLHGFRFSRNFGSHVAITCGLNHARGDCAIVMAADLQDPPETIPHLLTEWQQGAHVVWAARERREGERAGGLRLSRLYHGMMRRVSGLQGIPAEGADFFLLDRRVIDAFNRFHEKHVSMMALITWMGFRQAWLRYTKQARLHGRSGWTLRKKLKLVVDSITAFTFFPIRLMSYLGFLVGSLGFLYAGVVVVNALAGRPVQGWSSLMVVVLVLGGLQMLLLGVLGEYVWRGLDEARQRPQYLIEACIGRAPVDPRSPTRQGIPPDRGLTAGGSATSGSA